MNVSNVKNAIENLDPETMARSKEAIAAAADGMVGTCGLASVQEAVCDMLISGGGISGVSKAEDGGKSDKVNPEAPVIDEPEVGENELDIADLAKLVALLKNQTDELQASEARKRVENQKDEIASRAKKRLDDIDQSLEDMDKAARAATAMKWFSVIACIAGAALTFLTAGIASGIVALIISTVVLAGNLSGGTEWLTKQAAEGLQEIGFSKNTANLVASVGMAIIEIAATAGLNVGMSVGCAASSIAAKVVQVVVSTLISFGGIGGQVYVAFAQEDAANDDVELTRFEALMTTLRQKLEEAEKELEEIIQQLADGPAQIAKLLESTMESQNLIARNIGQMA